MGLRLKISIDELADVLKDTLTEYGQKIVKKVDEAGEKITKKTVKKLKETSPKRIGDYAKNWTSKSFNNYGEAKKQTIHNAKHYRLTHLLEYGHITRNGKRTKARKHIEPAEKEAVEEFSKEVERGIEDVSK